MGQRPVYLPLVPGTKKPAVRGWNRDDYEGVEPGDHVALRTDGIVVVDCDTEEAAEAWENEATPTPVQVKTAKGRHFIYRRPEDSELRPGPLPGVGDIKTGPGAFVLPAGSLHPTGIRYENIGELPWSPGLQGLSVLPPAPTELIESLRPRAPEGGDGEGWDIIPEGRRNTTLAALAGTMRRQGAAPELIAQVLLGLNAGLVQPPLPRDEVLQIAASVARYEPDPDIEIELVDNDGEVVPTSGPDAELPVRWASGLERRPPPPWLWHPYLPQGRLVLLDGYEGIGKSMFAAWLAVKVTTGDLDAGQDAGPVLWFPAEDDPEEDILGRLEATGWNRAEHEDIAFVDVSDFSASAEPHMALLERRILEDHHRLVIFDPIRSFLRAPGDREYSHNSDAHVRPPMEALSRLAARTGATLLGVHHWRKSAEGGVRSRATGSGAFAQVVRHRVTMAWVGTTEDGEGAIAVEKSNIATTGHVRGYEIEGGDYPSWALGDAMPYTDLDAYLKAAEARTSPDVELEPSWVVQHHLEKKLQPGAAVPSREELMVLTGLSQRKVQEAIDGLRDEGILRSDGPRRPAVWTGSVVQSTNGEVR